MAFLALLGDENQMPPSFCANVFQQEPAAHGSVLDSGSQVEKSKPIRWRSE